MSLLARWRRAGRRATDPTVVLGSLLVALLAFVVAWPVVQMFRDTIAPDTRNVWSDVFTGPVSANLFWEPLRNTLVIGLITGLTATAVGGLVAWLVVMTDVPGHRMLALAATIPFALPTFALALAWESVFRNDRVGEARQGILAQAGVAVPDWLSWGMIPVIATMTAHYSSLAFLIIAAALANVGGDLDEAAMLTGASRRRILTAVTFPAVRPAVIGAFLLTFAEGASNFSAPALLGLPVRLQTLSTRIFGSITTGQRERGFALALLLIALAGIVLVLASYFQRAGRAASVGGRAGQSTRRPLGRWRWPAGATVWMVMGAMTAVPAILLATSSLLRRTGSLSSGFTLHYWWGESDPAIAQGQRGVLRNPAVLDAVWTTLTVSVAVAAISTVVGLLVGFTLTRTRSATVKRVLGTLSFVPFLIPGVALGAVLIGQFSTGFGPVPALYGTVGLLILAGSIAALPFAVQAGQATLSQVGADLEAAAVLAGAGFWRRLAVVVVPLALRGLVAGAVLSFVKFARDLDLVAVLATPTMTTLPVVAYRYASEGFTQMANSITTIIVVLSVVVTMLARRVEGRTIPWSR